MLNLDEITQNRIRKAQERGEFDRLPGAGAPLVLDDDTLEELRAVYRILKNAGFVPPELEAQREIRDLDVLLQLAVGDRERRRLIRSRMKAEG